MGYSDAYPGGYGVGTGDVITGFYIETDPDTWYDATADLISGNIIRGRSSPLDRYQAGTCVVELDNDDRTYDPTYAASPLNGYVLPMKRVKVVATWDGVTYPLFYGYADRWTQNRQGPHRGTTTLAVTDGLKVLERMNLAASAFGQEVIADDPVAWWRFDEAAGPPASDSVGDADLDTAAGAPEFGTDPLISRDGGASITLTTLDGVYTYRRFTRDDTTKWGHPLSFELVFKISASVPGTIAAVYQPNPTYSCGVALDSDYSSIGFQVGTGPGSATAVFSTVDYTDGLTHHVCGTWGPDDQLRIYVDGVNTSASGATRAPLDFPSLYFYLLVGHSPVDTQGFNGVVDEFVLYNTALSAARIAAHAEAVVTPWDGDLSGERIERVLDAAGWADPRDIDAGQTTLQSAALDMSALEHIQKVTETEFGYFYVAADGTARFEDRNSGVDQAAAFDFSDAAGADLPITFSNPEISDEEIRNDVTVSRLEGVAQNARDTTSIGTYQTSSYVRDGLYNDSDDHSRYMAQFILESYKDPVERVSSMGVNPYRDPDALWPAVLGLELTDRVTLTETPQWVTPAVTRTVAVEGITHTFAAKQWDTSFALSESTAQTTAYWSLGVAGFSELGETTRVFF